MRATEIMYSAQNANAAMIAAERIAKDIDQDWGHEATIYTLDDGSVLIVSGPQVNAYSDMASAVAALQV